MTKQEKHAIQRLIKHLVPYAPGSAYDENMKRLEVPEVVPGTPNHQLLDNPLYKAGFEMCKKEVADLLNFILTATNKDLIKYAGRAK